MPPDKKPAFSFLGVFLVVSSPGLRALLPDLKKALSPAHVYVKDESETATDFLDSSVSPAVTHIIAENTDFAEYVSSQTKMVPVTKPEWVFQSVQRARCVNLKGFSPDPAYFLKDVFLCAADNLPAGDKEVVYGGVRAFGGQYLDDLTQYTTHLVAVDTSNYKSIVAASAVPSETGGRSIQVVLPQWLDECILQRRVVDETPFLLSDPKVLASGVPDYSTEKASETFGAPRDAKLPFKDRSFYVSSDYNLLERLHQALVLLIEQNGGSVVDVFDLKKVDVYVGKYRLGDEYIACCRSHSVIVGTLAWIHFMVASQQWVDPLGANLLHYPVPKTAVPGFQGMKICISSYTTDIRFYLASLITTMGGERTKQLSRENKVLVASAPEGKKYNYAASVWKDTKGVQIVGTATHLWVEECFSRWQLLDHNDSRYLVTSGSTQGPVGQVRLSEESLRQFYEPKDASEGDNNVEDSMCEDGFSPTEQPGAVTLSGATDIPSSPKRAKKATSKDSKTAQKRVDSNTLVQELETTADKENVNISGRTGRSAKQKAALKLHSDMNDLNDYMTMAKSSRKMKTYMEGLELSTTPKKRKEADPEELVEEPPKKKASTPDGPAKHEVVAIMTGCELELGFNRVDLVRLAHVGIKIVADFSPRVRIDTIIAPRILRTEKFLKSLSTCERIVHPNYLVDIKKKLDGGHEGLTWAHISKEFNINDYSVEKVVPLKEINNELGVSGRENGLRSLLDGPQKGRVFEGLRLNLSANLNGGTSVIASILEAHGLEEAKSVKNFNANTAKGLLKNDNGEAVVVVHKTKDLKATKMLNTSGEKVVVVEWDWCVKSLFRLQLEPLESFRL